MKRVNKLKLAAGALLVLAFFTVVAGCRGRLTTPASQPVKKFKIAFVYPGTLNDAGWTQAQNQGRLYLQRLLPDVETSCVEAVNQGDDAERMLVELAEKGNRVVFAADSNYSEAAIRAAKRYPKTVFMVCSGTSTASNVGVYTGRMYQPRYLAGLVAGGMNKHGLIGYIAAYPNSEAIRNLNAFALGVREVNPKAIVKVSWTKDSLEMQKEKDAIKNLLRDGADVIVQQRDDPGMRPPASERNVHFIGSDGDLSKPVPMDDLACTGWDWGPIFVATVRAVQDGTWRSGQVWGDMNDRTVDLAPLNPIVPEAVAKLVSDRREQLLQGKRDVFTGPVKDQQGIVRLKAGQQITDSELSGMDWFVEGIEETRAVSPSLPGAR